MKNEGLNNNHNKLGSPLSKNNINFNKQYIIYNDYQINQNQPVIHR
jgi:hypothetical protein